MPRVKEKKVSDPLIDAINAIQAKNPSLKTENESEDKMVDIVTFCQSPKYLDLPGNNFKLWMSQFVILKCFYMGTRGNENLKLSKEEWEWLYAHEENEDHDGNVFENNIQDVIKKVLKKEKDDFNFRELHLVLGRRSSKTTMASIISAYEVYKLMVIGDGNPHKFYDLPEGSEIAIINVALSLQQAGRLFEQIQTRLRNSPFFSNRIAKGTSSEIRLFTDLDLKKKEEASNLDVPGSISILCGHSNPDTLAGHNAILILFDELAFYEEGGKVSGSHFYNRLKPSLAHFYNYGDGRTVQISSPNTMNGIFYDTYVDSKKFDDILSFQLPTWEVNPGIKYDHPDLVKERERNPDAFAIEYGAQWAKSGSFGTYFPEELINRSVNAGITHGLTTHSRQQQGISYYMHIDPAKHGYRYCAIMVGKENYVNHLGKKRVRVLLTGIWIWEPEPGVGLLFNEIDRQVIKICSIFRPMMVTYDQYNSIQSMQLLRSHGINCVQTSYNRSFKNKIYQNVREMMAYYPEPELWLYDDPRLVLELKALKFRPTARGIGFLTDKNGDVKTDDLVDCLCGAVGSASEATRAGLPAPLTVNTGRFFF